MWEGLVIFYFLHNMQSQWEMAQNNDRQMDVERENAEIESVKWVGKKKRKLQMSRGVLVQRARELQQLCDTEGREKL